jgi:membrane fusion protein (multidrug efflux system)
MRPTPSPFTSADRAFRYTLAGLAGALLLVSTACEKEKAAPPAAPAVEIVTVSQRDVPIYLEWIGSLDGNVNAVIRPQVTGYLIRQNYREGELVKQGQPLFEIDPRTFEAAVEEAKGLRAQQAARYETTRANLARIKPLAAMNAVSQKDLDDATGADLSAKASLEAAEASLKTAKLNLGFTRITSPVTGIAGIAKAQIGDLLSPSMTTELTTVSTVDPIKVYFNISEREYLKVAAPPLPLPAKRRSMSPCN